MAEAMFSIEQIREIKINVGGRRPYHQQRLHFHGRLTILFIGIVSILSGLLRAEVVYDNGPPDNRNGSEMTRWIEADDFVLNQATRLDGIRFWDYEIDGFFSGTVLWQIYSDDGSGRPAQLLLSGTSTNLDHSPTGILSFGFKEYVTTFNIVPVSLARGKYWLALHNGQLSNSSSENFFWETTESVTGFPSHKKETPFTGAWCSNSFPDLPSEFAFQINGASVPSLTAFAAEGNARRISFTTTSGYRYRVEYKDRLSDASWTLLPGAEAIAGTGNVLQVTDSPPVGRQSRFYRIGFSYSAAGAPVISAFGLGSSGPTISFKASAGFYYRVEYKNDLGDASWVPLEGAETLLGTGETIQVIDSQWDRVTQPFRVYRVVLF